MENTRNKILVADDEEPIRIISNEILHENFPQFEVELFENGISLENRLKKGVNDVKLIITDNQMPGGVWGSEIILKYAKRPEYSDVRFIFSYGGDDRLGPAAVEAGAFDYIKKPVPGEVYVDAVRKALGLQ